MAMAPLVESSPLPPKFDLRGRSPSIWDAWEPSLQDAKLMPKSDDLQMQSGRSPKPAGKRIAEGQHEFMHDSWNIVPSELNFNAYNAGGVIRTTTKPLTASSLFENIASREGSQPEGHSGVHSPASKCEPQLGKLAPNRAAG